jgi:hypothetical protein
MSATGPGTVDPRCTKHPEVTLVVYPRRWGWVCPRCRAAGQSTLQPYPFVPLPLFGLLNLYPLSWTFARLPVPLLFRRERRSALLSAGIAYSSALVSPGSRLPHEAGRLFTRQSPQGSASPTRSSRSLSTFRPFFAADRGGRFLSSRDS